MTTATHTIVDEIVSKAKKGTHTYGEALNRLHIAMLETPHAKWTHYDTAASQLMNEMKAQVHSVDPSKPYD